MCCSSFRKRYLRRYKDGYDDPERKLLSVEEMSRLVCSIMDPRDKATAMLLAKTRIRRSELLKLDINDINWEDYSITLTPTPKRSNSVVFFDDECAVVLRRWLRVRYKLNPGTKALFVSYQSLNRLDRNGLYTAIVKYARRLGFHNPESARRPFRTTLFQALVHHMAKEKRHEARVHKGTKRGQEK